MSGHSVCLGVGAWDVRLQILDSPEKDNSIRSEITRYVAQTNWKTDMHACLYVYVCMYVCMRFLLSEHQI